MASISSLPLQAADRDVSAGSLVSQSDSVQNEQPTAAVMCLRAAFRVAAMAALSGEQGRAPAGRVRLHLIPVGMGHRAEAVMALAGAVVEAAPSASGNSVADWLVAVLTLRMEGSRLESLFALRRVLTGGTVARCGGHLDRLTDTIRAAGWSLPSRLAVPVRPKSGPQVCSRP